MFWCLCWNPENCNDQYSSLIIVLSLCPKWKPSTLNLVKICRSFSLIAAELQYYISFRHTDYCIFISPDHLVSLVLTWYHTWLLQHVIIPMLYFTSHNSVVTANLYFLNSSPFSSRSLTLLPSDNHKMR